MESKSISISTSKSNQIEPIYRAIKQIFPGAWKVLHTTLTLMHYFAWFAIRVFIQNGLFVAYYQQYVAEVNHRIEVRDKTNVFFVIFACFIVELIDVDKWSLD